MACGLAAIIATVSPALASGSPASAAADAHSRHPPGAAETRDIRHERHIQGVRETRGAGQARKARAAARPWTITVPSIGVATNLVPLGAPDGSAGPDALSLPVPPLAKAATETGWYRFTAAPGAAGNAVIVGHVDTYIGPAVFYNLYRLRPGAPVYVVADGTRQRFDVTSVRELPKPSFPVSQVFGSTKRHMLWLITCGGAFDYETRHYLDNIVVSASWVPGPGKVPRHTRENARRTRLKSLGNGTLVAITVEDGVHLPGLSACLPDDPVSSESPGRKDSFPTGENAMKRVIAVTATLVTAATATMVAAATIAPAMAAPRPITARPMIARPAAHAKLAASNAATEIDSELQDGKYVTVVRCHGVDSPPPVQLAKPGTPLTVSGVGPSAAIAAMLHKPNPYKTVYTCTVIIEVKVPPKATRTKATHKRGCEIATGGAGRTGGGCTKAVTLNTGFGGMSSQVKNHHPAG
jgi:hypothetical protein